MRKGEEQNKKKYTNKISFHEFYQDDNKKNTAEKGRVT